VFEAWNDAHHVWHFDTVFVRSRVARAVQHHESGISGKLAVLPDERVAEAVVCTQKSAHTQEQTHRTYQIMTGADERTQRSTLLWP
jgi:hypothetical protein